MRPPVLVFLLLALSFAPPAGAQEPVEGCSRQCLPTDPDVNPASPMRDGPVNVILYAHYVEENDLLGFGSITTHAPDPEVEPELSRTAVLPDFVTSTGVCVGQICSDFTFNNAQWHWEFCPGDWETADGRPYLQCHSPSLPGPVQVVGPMVLYFYIGVDATTVQDTNGIPDAARAGAAPSVTLHAALLDFFEETEVFAQGSSETVHLVSAPGEAQVFEFRVELKPDPAMLDDNGVLLIGDAGQRIRIELEQLETPEMSYTQRDWQVHVGPRFMPRLVVPLQDPLTLRSFRSYAEQGELRVQADVFSPLGAYDVNETTISLALRSAGGALVSSDVISLINLRQGKATHDGVHKPVNVTWQIDTQRLEAKDGPLTAEIAARNRQDTFEVTGSIPLSLTEFSGRARTPGPDVLAMVLVVGALVFLRDRRHD